MSLHLERKLIACDARGQFGIVGARCHVGLIALVERVEEAPLGRLGKVLGWLKMQNGVFVGLDDCGLISSRHIARGPVFRSGDWSACGIKHDHKTRKVLILATKSISDPGTKRRVTA